MENEQALTEEERAMIEGLSSASEKEIAAQMRAVEREVFRG